MNIFEYAMQMEEDLEQHYRDMAEDCGNKGMKKIFTMLADEEAKHYKAVKRMKEQEDVDPEMTETKILDRVNTVIGEIRDEKDVAGCGENQVDVYVKAREIEGKSRDFYNEKAAEVDKEKQKDLFRKLAKEENKHFNIMENMIELVRRPERWLEDAEFFKIEEY